MTSEYIDILRSMVEFLKVGFYENTDIPWPWYGNDDDRSKIYLGYWGAVSEKKGQKIPRIIAQRISAINYGQTTIDERATYDISGGSFDSHYAVLFSAQFAYNCIASNDIDTEGLASYVMDMIITGKKDLISISNTIKSIGSAQMSVPSQVTANNVTNRLMRVYVSFPVVWEHDVEVNYENYDTYDIIRANGNLNDSDIVIQ